MARHTPDVLVIGAGLSGLAEATEACDAGPTATLVDQESEANLGGQAYWSLVVPWSTACSRQARPRASAEAECTGTTLSRARSWADACSPVAWPGAPPLPEPE